MHVVRLNNWRNNRIMGLIFFAWRPPNRASGVVGLYIRVSIQSAVYRPNVNRTINASSTQAIPGFVKLSTSVLMQPTWGKSIKRAAQ